MPKSNLVFFFLSKRDSNNKNKRSSVQFVTTNWTLDNQEKTFSIRVTESEMAGDFHGRGVHIWYIIFAVRLK